MSTPPDPHLQPTAGVALVVGEDSCVHREAEQRLCAAGFDVDVLVAPAAKLMEAVEQAAARLPRVAVVVVLPADSLGAALRKALRSGAAGIVYEDQIGATLVATASAVAAGQLAIPPALRRQLAPRPLSHREKQVLKLVVLGYTNRQIADELYVAESTVKTHLSSAFAKLETRSRSEAAALILDPEEGYGLGVLPITEPTQAAA